MRAHPSYKNFAELLEFEHEGVSYRRKITDRQSAFVIIAPHGGGIEPGTSEVAEAIAGAEFSYYTFDGLKQEGNIILHITSTLFDEPKCLQLVNDSEAVVAIHGCAGGEKASYVGGLYAELKTYIVTGLTQAGFDARLAEVNYVGTQSQNICNRGQSGRGVQIEISEGLRRTMFAGLDRQGRKHPTDVFRNFVSAIHEALITFMKNRG